MLDAWFRSGNATTAAAVTRSSDEQRVVDAATATMALYHYDSCMYCARVRRAIEQLSLQVELRDILTTPEHRAALITGGGRSTVPCLRIDTPGGTEWMYESTEIVRYLSGRFGQPVTPR